MCSHIYPLIFQLRCFGCWTCNSVRTCNTTYTLPVITYLSFYQSFGLNMTASIILWVICMNILESLTVYRFRKFIAITHFKWASNYRWLTSASLTDKGTAAVSGDGGQNQFNKENALKIFLFIFLSFSSFLF